MIKFELQVYGFGHLIGLPTKLASITYIVVKFCDDNVLQARLGDAELLCSESTNWEELWVP